MKPAAESVEAPLWYAMPVEVVCDTLTTRGSGLKDEEVRSRLERYGQNRLPTAPRIHPLLRFLAQFNNALIYFLLAAGVVAAVLGHLVDGAVIVAVVLINAIVGFIQEGKAESALDAIRDMIAPMATVMRGGRRHVVNARDIVPGDIVLLEAGDKVPADIRLIRARGLLVDEAILTGESVPAEKREQPVLETSLLGDRACMLYSGTLVATGQAAGVAVATGAATEIGAISTMIGQVRAMATPLLQQINRFGRMFSWFALAVAVLLFAFAILVRGYNWVDALMVVVALAVGAIPEGLPAVITITLAIGVQRMAARNAVVRRLPAVETLGATSVICSDKTGTLTRNEMTACRVVTPGASVLVTGGGYEPVGAISDETGEPTQPDPVREALIRAALLCNDSQLAEHDGRWRTTGDPMEGALVTLAVKAGFDPEEERRQWQRLDEIPFDALHRFMATLHHGPDDQRRIFVKGAPEKVLAMCSTQAGAAAASPVDETYWRERIAAAAANGERVLGFAAMPAGEDLADLSFDALEEGLVFLGVVGFIDPPREEAVAAIAECRSAGIAVKMITGDHNGTAVAIARQLAIADDPHAMDGAELEGLSDAQLRDVVERTSVFSRASPAHKLRIVRALQANGHVVAMTGDGVNDAPSLKQADIGIAMGRKGTEAAKEAAGMVLVDDNFASIVAAVHEGRTVYDNIRKVFGWTLPTNGGETLCIVVALALGIALPMTPVQILWINMITAMTLGLALAFEPAEPNVMQRPPRSRVAPLLPGFLVWRVALVSVLFTIGVFGMLEYALQRGLGEAASRTIVVNTLVVMEIFYLFNVRYLHMTSFSLRGLMGTRAVLITVSIVAAAQVLFTYAPFMHRLFGSAAISVQDGALIVAAGIILMVVLELEKSLMRRLGKAIGSYRQHS